MEAKAFCPAHVTGFFTAHLDDSQKNSENLGSMGAGFSIKQGVTTSVRVSKKQGQVQILKFQQLVMNQIKQMCQNLFLMNF